MKHLGKHNLLGVFVSALDYEAAVDNIIRAAQQGRGFSVTALAVHGVMTGVLDRAQRYRLNHMDLVTPDGQPVRWGLNLLHQTKLPERVYGPRLMLEVLTAAVVSELPVYFYGSRLEVLERLAERLQKCFPALVIAGMEPSKFRVTTPEEKEAIGLRIKSSGAKMTFVGLGCPRQEVFAYEYRDLLGMPIIAVGAAFDFYAGVLKEAPTWAQRWGLQWCVRLAQEPRRLWWRYLLLNPAYLFLLTCQALRLWKPKPDQAKAPSYDLRYG